MFNDAIPFYIELLNTVFYFVCNNAYGHSENRRPMLCSDIAMHYCPKGQIPSLTVHIPSYNCLRKLFSITQC